MSAHFKSKFLGTVILVANLIITIQLNAAPVISEIMANNESILADIDGDFSDWIEIHNPGNADFNLEGLFLTDNADNLTSGSSLHLLSELVSTSLYLHQVRAKTYMKEMVSFIRILNCPVVVSIWV